MFLRNKGLDLFLRFSFWELKAQLLSVVCSQLMYYSRFGDDSKYRDSKQACLEILFSIFNIYENKLILRSSFKVSPSTSARPGR